MAIISLLLLLGTADAFPQTIEFLYEQHPPFTYSKKGEVLGIFIEPTERTAAKAGFVIKWTETSFNRIRREIYEGSEPRCVAGHGRNPDLDKKYPISLPIGHFGRSGLLIRAADQERFQQISSVKALFTETDLTGGFVKDAKYAVSYESYLPASKAKHLIVSSTHERLAQLVARGRLDFIFENELMLPIHQKIVEREPNKLAFTVLPGMPTARTAHIVCTAAFPEEWMKRLNEGIQAVQKHPTGQ